VSERKLERIVEITPAFDKRDQDPRKDRGVHGCELRMLLKGPEGAVQFVLFTGWYLPGVIEWWKSRGLDTTQAAMPADLGYHSRVPMYEGQNAIMESCPYLDGAPCYYDGSSLNAEGVFQLLLEGGSDAVWSRLEEFYEDTFDRENDQ
jgi:hypothetical protein